eukprot:6061708-Pyramimonas_sp.AAC.1
MCSARRGLQVAPGTAVTSVTLGCAAVPMTRSPRWEACMPPPGSQVHSTPAHRIRPPTSPRKPEAWRVAGWAFQSPTTTRGSRSARTRPPSRR